MTRLLLSALFAEFPFYFSPSKFPATYITGIAFESREVEAGNLFVAMQGSTADGHDFIHEAIAQGAAAVVGEKSLEGLSVPYILVKNSRQALTYLAAAFYQYPAHKLTVIGVTGTDGKTTTCNLLYHILLAADLKVGLISTVNAVIGNEEMDTGFHVTTPDAPDAHRYLAKMVEAGLTHVVLETTSHGWSQHRVDACEFDVGIVTNITHEHLNEHGSYENYRAAKARLLYSLVETQSKPQGNPRLAVLNRDDASFFYLAEVVQSLMVNHPLKMVTYGYGDAADVRAKSVQCTSHGILFEVEGSDFRLSVKSPLVGDFNVSNCLAALAASIYGLNINLETAIRGIAASPGIPGRMERIDLGQPFSAIVDFAHTPNALRVALKTARGMIDVCSIPIAKKEKKINGKGRVIVIFGSAGLRDKEKRRMMAETSAELADVSILTAEDPRTESLDEILEEMMAGAKSKGGVEGKNVFRVADRREAIRFGIHLAHPGDIVLSCGKGHEQSMCFGTTEYSWDDRIALRSALAELMGIPGPQMPFLPRQE